VSLGAPLGAELERTREELGLHRRHLAESLGRELGLH
jgi:hypothetical protein